MIHKSRRFKLITALTVVFVMLFSFIPISFADDDPVEVSSAGNPVLYNALVSVCSLPDDGAILRSELHNLVGALNLDSRGITNISGLQYCDQIHTLSLANNAGLADISPLGTRTMPLLQNVYLNGCSFSAVPGFQMPDLINLNLEDNTNLADISSLSTFTGDYFQNLYLSDTGIDSGDLSALSALTHLVRIDAANCGLVDFSDLKELSSLQTLDLSDNDITALPNMSAMTGLRSFYIRRNDLGGMTGIAPNLTFIEASSNQITDISALSALSYLAILYLSHNRVSDITPLPVVSLNNLYLDSNMITDINALDNRTFSSLFIYNNYLDLTDTPASADWVIIRDHFLSKSYYPQRKITVNYNTDGADTLSPTGNLYYGQSLSLPGVMTHAAPGTFVAGTFEGWDINADGVKDSNPYASIYVQSSDLDPEANIAVTYKAIYNAVTESGNPELYDALCGYTAAGDDGAITNTELEDITNSVSLNSCGISDISGLEYLQNATGLSLNDNSISDITPLQYCTSLLGLDAAGNNITDASPVALLTGLKNLDLHSNDLSDIDALKDMAGLESLSAGGNASMHALPSDLSGMHSLTYMELGELSMTGTQWQRLTALPALEALDIYGTGLDDMGFLSPITTLKSLFCGGNNITDVTSVCALTNLRNLDISYNAIGNAGLGLIASGLTHLSYLGACGTGISNIGALSGSGLAQLEISYNEIADISALSTMPDLEFLSAWGNYITDLSALSASSIYYLSIGGNYLDITPGSADMQVITGWPAYGYGSAYYSPQRTTDITYANETAKGTAGRASDTGICYGQSITLPAVAPNPGYAFTGWDTDGNGVPDKAGGETIAFGWPVLPIAGDAVTFTAHYLTLDPNSALSNLEATQPLSPAFSAGQGNYTISLPAGTGSVTITPTAAANASFTIDDASVPSVLIPVYYGEQKTVTIEVTAQDGFHKSQYYVTVSRGLPAASTLLYLGNSAGTLSPAFDPYTVKYSLTLNENTATVTIRPTKTAAADKMTIDGKKVLSKTYKLNQGDKKTVKIVVTSAANKRVKHTYQVAVSRQKSSNADLKSLKLKNAALVPVFNKDTLFYTVNIPAAKTSVTITAAASAKGAVIKFGTKKSSSSSVKLNKGETKTIVITVTAPNGINKKTYTLIVTRASA